MEEPLMIGVVEFERLVMEDILSKAILIPMVQD